jgi:hypothetical protein
MFTYRSESRMNELVAKANKPLVKLGLPLLVVTSVTPRKVSIVTEAGQTVHYIVYDAEITVPEELVRIAGTQVVARIENVEGLNMVTRIGGYEGNLDTYRTAAIECQHCGFKRNRKGSWIVLNTEGQQIQVGDTCVDLYFGVDVARILSTSYHVHSILDSDDWGMAGGSRKDYDDAAAFIATIAWIASTKGFVTKKQVAEQGWGMSSANYASYLCHPLCPIADAKERAEYYAARQEAHEWLKATYGEHSVQELVMDFWMEKDNLSEFEHNCRVSILAQSLRYEGLVAYATKIWVDTVKKAEAVAKAALAPTAPRTVSQWVATKGERIVLTLTVKNIYSYETDYGTTTMFIFNDEQGNCIVWKATSNPSMEVGQTYSIKGTVKGHTDYKGIKQTLLTRCQIG